MPSPLSLQAQPEGLDLIQLSYLSWLEAEEIDRGNKYTMFRNYYDGDHATQLTKRMRAFLELESSQEFSLNHCPIVVDSLAEKLKVAGFEVDGKPDDTLKSWWSKNRMDAMQGVVHLATVRDGDGYVLVEWDNDKGIPRFTQENAFDGTEGMHIVYSDEHRLIPKVAIKKWIIDSGMQVTTVRENHYYADRIEKYTDNGTGTWQPYIDEENGEWPIDWTDDAGKPLGIPVVHFRNKDQGYSYGKSELEDIIPVQNGGNKVFIDLLAAGDLTGFRIFTAIGFNPSDMKLAPGSWAYTENPDGEIGAIDAASLDGLIALKDSVIMEIAKISRTPLSFFQFTGQIAGADTQKEGRAGLTAKARDRQTTFGNSWEDVMLLGIKLSNKFGEAMPEDVEISTVWEDDEKPEMDELADTAVKLTQSSAASIQTKVKHLHPDWDEKEIEAEVELIKAEQGMAVPDLGPLPTDTA